MHNFFVGDFFEGFNGFFFLILLFFGGFFFGFVVFIFLFLKQNMGTGNRELRSLVVSVEFEVIGEVQGLYYMKYCKEECLKLGLCGWVKSTRRGAIVGKIQGPRPKIEQMISWLSNRGSPGSRIDTCYLYNYEYLPRPDFRGFNIRF